MLLGAALLAAHAEKRSVLTASHSMVHGGRGAMVVTCFSARHGINFINRRSALQRAAARCDDRRFPARWRLASALGPSGR